MSHIRRVKKVVGPIFWASRRIIKGTLRSSKKAAKHSSRDVQKLSRRTSKQIGKFVDRRRDAVAVFFDEQKHGRFGSLLGRSSPEEMAEAVSWQLPSDYRLIEEVGGAPQFPIDVVYTWVDSDDPAFIDVLNEHLPADEHRDRRTMSEARFKNHDELKYSLRSLESYAPWVNKIFIVTNGQRPQWLAEHPKVELIDHRQILSEKYLPTFNSHVIGSALHRIPGLSEHYIYFNDDVMLLRPVMRSEAFTAAGLAYAYVSQNTIDPGPPIVGETATEWGAKNARDLIQRKWDFAVDRRFTHMFHCQRKSVAAECEHLFAEEYDAFRTNRFRQMNDLLCCSFLHHYAAYITGKALLRPFKGHYIRVRHESAKRQYRAVLSKKGADFGRSVMCLNDFLPPEGALPDYHDLLFEFLEAYYPEPSSFERTETALAADAGVVSRRKTLEFDEQRG